MKAKSALFFLAAIAVAIGGFIPLPLPRPLMGLLVATGLTLIGLRYSQEVPSPRAQMFAILGWTLVVAGTLLGAFIPV